MARQLDPTKRKLTDIQCKSAKPLRDELLANKLANKFFGCRQISLESDGAQNTTEKELNPVFIWVYWKKSD